MNLDVEFLKTAMPYVVSILTALWTFLRTQDKDNSRHLKAVEQALTERIAALMVDVQAHQVRFERIEGKVALSASASDVAAIQSSVAGVKATIESMTGHVDNLNQAVVRLTDFLMQHK